LSHGAKPLTVCGPGNQCAGSHADFSLQPLTEIYLRADDDTALKAALFETDALPAARDWI
jgi:hypothetical protein